MSSPIQPQAPFNQQPGQSPYGQPSPFGQSAYTPQSSSYSSYGLSSQAKRRQGVSPVLLGIGAFGAVLATIGLFTPYVQGEGGFSWFSTVSDDAYSEYLSAAPFTLSIIVLLLALGLAVVPMFVKSKVTGLVSGVVQLAAGVTVFSNVMVNSDIGEADFTEVFSIGWYLLGIGSIILVVTGVLTLIFAIRSGGASASGPAPSAPSYGVPGAYQQPAPRPAGMPQPGMPGPQAAPRPQPGPYPGQPPQTGMPQPGAQSGQPPLGQGPSAPAQQPGPGQYGQPPQYRQGGQA